MTVDLCARMSRHRNLSFGSLPARDHDLLSQFEQEVPVTAPIFEGHLYLRTNNKQWKWRLFRFDGFSFTCLSMRKNKFPPGTAVDAVKVMPHVLQTSSSAPCPLTSPLFATPKDKARRLTSGMDITGLEPVKASYYQLPKWTVNVFDIKAVSILQRRKRNSFLPGSGVKSKCFSIRTFDSKRYILKAQNEKDLDHWLFVLTRMWEFAQVFRSQQQQQQYLATPMPSAQVALTGSAKQPVTNLSHPLPPYPHHHSLPSIPQRTSVIHMPVPPMKDPQDHRPLVCSVAPALPRGPYVQPTLAAQDLRNSDQPYPHPVLSREKAQWIDRWRRSLGELMEQDPSLRLEAPPPIVPIPDDDAMSIRSGMTSVSNRQHRVVSRSAEKVFASRLVQRHNSKISTRSTSVRRAERSNCVSHPEVHLEDRQQGTSLKKKRSNDVKHWIEPLRMRNQDNESAINYEHDPSSEPKPSSTSLQVAGVSTPDSFPDELFQDVRSANESPAGGTDSAQSLPKIHYHTTLRGKKIKVRGVSSADASTGACTNKNMELNQLRTPSSLGDQMLHGISPLQTLVKVGQSIQQQTQPTSVDDNDVDEMSLADLRKKLQRMSMNRSASELPLLDSSNVDLTSHMFPPMSSIVAPAMPPVVPTHSYYYSAHDLEMNTSVATKRPNSKDKSGSWSPWPYASSLDLTETPKERPQSWIPPSVSSSAVDEKKIPDTNNQRSSRFFGRRRG